MTSAFDRATWLRERITHGPLVLLPGIANALGARVVEDLGFEALYVSGAGVANTFLGTPDIGLITLSELAMHVAAIRDAVDIPIVVDADTGFGNVVNVVHTVQVLERAGADALQLEDQVSPKRCGHFEGKAVITTEEMEQKIKAAVEARSTNLVIIARTDARAVEGLDAALERGQAYMDAGADAVFIEAPSSKDELLSLPRRLAVPHVVNLVDGGKTPLLPVIELSEFRIALFANLSLQASVRAMQDVLGALKEHGAITTSMRGAIVDWNERQRLVRKPEFDALESRLGTRRER
jgi:2-methylisocitrate lyase-like PEP mutase family enzyme